VLDENLISTLEVMNKAKIKQRAEEVLSDELYTANLDNKYDRKRLAGMIETLLLRISAKGGFFNNDYRRDRGYTEYRVTQMLGLATTDRLTDMRADEIAAWSELLDIPPFDLIQAGAGYDKLTLNEINALLRKLTGESIILETTELQAA
jgi:hypothetical protein